MVLKIPNKYIEKEIIKYRSKARQKKPVARKAPNKIITISSQLGTGSRSIAEDLGKKLGCKVWDKEILDVLASQSGWGYRAGMFESLDEKAQNVIDALVGNFFGSADKHTYLYLLPKAVHLITQNDAIILGRGAHLLLSDSFRVRIKAPFEIRVKNMMTYEGLSEKKAREVLNKNDKQRESFLKELARKFNVKDYQDQFDLVINADWFDIKGSASVILHGFALYYHRLKEVKP